MQILTWNQKPSEDNETVLTSGKQMTQYNFELMDCYKEECGAWQSGKCCYASVNLNNS